MKHYPNKKIILLLDNVKYHHTKKVIEFIEHLDKNIEFKFIPPYSSELNAIEHLWKDLRKDITHNHLFDNIKEILLSVRKYFTNVRSNPAKIKRLCAYIY